MPRPAIRRIPIGTDAPARRIARLPVLLVALLLTPMAARAQQDLPTFDCAALLSDTGAGEASAKTRQRLSAAPLRFTWDGETTRPDRADPIVLVPMRSGITARLARSEPVPLDDGVMSCTLIGISFRPALDEPDPYMVQDLREGPRPAELPLLLVGRHDTAAAADAAFSAWVNRAYPIPVAFPEPMRNATGAGVTVIGDHRAFLPTPLLGNTDWNETNVLALNPERAPQDTRVFLRAAGLDRAGVILALCGSADCTDFRAARPGVAPVAGPEVVAQGSDQPEGDDALWRDDDAEAPRPPSAPATSPRPADRALPPEVTREMPAGPDTETATATPSPDTPSSDTAQPSAQGDTIGTQTNPALQGADPSEPTRPGGLPPLRLTYLGTDGREEDLPPALSGRFDCVLTALGAEIFTETPDCPDRAFEALRDRRALLRRVDEGHWQIVAGARDRPPRAVIVTLPPGQSGAACRMDLDYDGPDGAPVRLALNPVAGATPAQFTAIPVIPLPVRNGQVRMRLSVSAAAACGAPGREISVPTEAILSLDLAGEARVNRAALHVVAMDAGDLEVALGLDPAGRLRLGAQIIGAVESAQARLAAGWGPEAWSLSSVGLTRLDETEGLVRILALPSDALRSGADTRFAAIPAATRSELAEMRPRVTPETLAEALEPAVADAAARGITQLSLTLIAPVTPRTAVALADPCTDQRFASLARDLSRPDGPEISVTVFPLVRLRPGDAPDLETLQPLSFDPDAPSRPAGLTRCRAAPGAPTTYPFFIEPWRPDGDITGRYAATLADRLALHLADRLTEDKARP
ncbi:MAG: hypothetical protein ACU0AY_15010 [Marinibacterium profundimaris]|uniref:Uncharacterized protein n=2 Tax=Marinibacterium profundimaris TaxID=1679460 RepID=A0A225NV65_9RHOB|nr:hypothetical protein ATO3_01070 [Marinibacterium profundimaris]